MEFMLAVTFGPETRSQVTTRFLETHAPPPVVGDEAIGAILSQ